MTPIDRRKALGLLALAPLSVRAGALAARQTRAHPGHRVVLSDGHGLLLEPDGTVQIWITGFYGNRLDAVLGLGGNVLPPFTLARVPGLTDVVAVDVGEACSFAVRGDGTLVTWGINGGNGKLGTTPLSFVEERASWGPDSNVPVPLAVGFDAAAVSSLDNHVLALSRDGRVYAWGSGDKGQLGIGPMPVIRFRTQSPSAMPYVPFPVEVSGLSGVVGISAGSTHSLAVMGDGTVQAWGENRWGQVGDGTTLNRDAPVVVPGVQNAVAVAAGSEFSAALLADGTVMTWGNRLGGALGRTPEADSRADPVPARVPGVRDVRMIVAGDAHVLALAEDGTVLSWGQPDFGALGRRGATEWAPGSIPGVDGVQSVSAHGITSVAVLESGRILTWGGVRPWTRPPEEGSYDNLSHRPILLWLDGLEQP